MGNSEIEYSSPLIYIYVPASLKEFNERRPYLAGNYWVFLGKNFRVRKVNVPMHTRLQYWSLFYYSRCIHARLFPFLFLLSFLWYRKDFLNRYSCYYIFQFDVLTSQRIQCKVIISAKHVLSFHKSCSQSQSSDSIAPCRWHCRACILLYSDRNSCSADTGVTPAALGSINRGDYDVRGLRRLLFLRVS